MRIIKYISGTIAGLAFFALLGSAGACDAGTISLGQSMIQSIISLVVFAASTCLAMYLDTKEKEKKIMNTITIELCAEDRARLDRIIEGLLLQAQLKLTVTPADVQAKVVSLVQSGKRDEVKSIVTAYAPCVGEIPEDKLAEVMDKLTALEG